MIAFCACTMSKRRRKQRVCDPIYCENPFCPQDGKEYSSMSAFTQHIDRSVSCQQFVQGHLVGTASLLCMTSNNAEASSVVTNNKKPSVLRREMVNEIAGITKLNFQMLHVPCHAIIKMHTSTAKVIALMRPPSLSSHPRNVPF